MAIIGSHSDLIESASDKEKEKSSLIQAMAARRIKKQEFAGYLSMDCRLDCRDTPTRDTKTFQHIHSTSVQRTSRANGWVEYLWRQEPSGELQCSCVIMHFFVCTAGGG